MATVTKHHWQLERDVIQPSNPWNANKSVQSSSESWSSKKNQYSYDIRGTQKFLHFCIDAMEGKRLSMQTDRKEAKKFDCKTLFRCSFLNWLWGWPLHLLASWINGFQVPMGWLKILKTSTCSKIKSVQIITLAFTFGGFLHLESWCKHNHQPSVRRIEAGKQGSDKVKATANWRVA